MKIQLNCAVGVTRKSDRVQGKVAPLKWLFYWLFSRPQRGLNGMAAKMIRDLPPTVLCAR